jgi:hypothetical protein
MRTVCPAKTQIDGCVRLVRCSQTMQRIFVVVEPSSVLPDGDLRLTFCGAEILAKSTAEAARTYVEQRKELWGKPVHLWVVDRFRVPAMGPDTYHVRFSLSGEAAFW